VGLPRTLSEYREKWEPRLLSSSEAERERAVKQLIREGLLEFAPDLKDAALKGVHLVYVFSHALEADTPFVGYFVRSGLGDVLRKNWGTVQRFLLDPRVLRNELREAAPSKAWVEPLFSDRKVWEWFQRESSSLFDWLKSVAWIVRCESCNARVRPNQFLVERAGEYVEAENVFIVKERRYWCTRPRCTARYFVRMAMNTEGEEGEKLRKQLKELSKKNPYVAKEIERMGREVLKNLS
jgi:hypothetical protein